MTAPESDVFSAITVIENGRIAYEENGDHLFESASSIKSAIGLLAIECAAARGIDLDENGITLTNAHYSNGSGVLKLQPMYLPTKADSGVRHSRLFSLREILDFNITISDCVATNVLIDYVGGKDEVNRRLASDLGLESTMLLAEHLQFPGVDHATQTHQVGTTTTRDLARYYQTIWGDQSKWRSKSPAHEWYEDIHGQVEDAKLFGMHNVQLPGHMEWAHKTGTIVTVRPDIFYGTALDAGRLTVDDRQLFIGAAATTLTAARQGHQMQEFFGTFADRNRAALATLDVTVDDLTSAVYY